MVIGILTSCQGGALKFQVGLGGDLGAVSAQGQQLRLPAADKRLILQF